MTKTEKQWQSGSPNRQNQLLKNSIKIQLLQVGGKQPDQDCQRSHKRQAGESQRTSVSPPT